MNELPILHAVRIDSLAYGTGHGVGRHQGKVVFVEQSCPGDLVDVRLTQRKKRMDLGRIESLLEASPKRRTPPCPHAETCGGCSWQSISYEEQLKQKAAILSDHLMRLGGFEAPTISRIHGEEFGFRRKARFHINPKGHFGFYAKHSRDVVVFERCPILHHELSTLIELVRACLTKLPALCGELELGVGMDGLGVACLKAYAPGWEKTVSRLLKDIPSLKGISVRHQGRWKHLGDTAARFTLATEPKPYHQQARDFWQSNVDVNGQVQQRMDGIMSDLSSRNIVELFGGSGNLTLLLGNHAPVRMVEQNPSACTTARKNLSDQPPQHPVTVDSTDAEPYLKKLLHAKHPIDTLVLDPPRIGFPKGLQSLNELGVKDLIYLSCNPSTLARDLSQAREQGFRLVSADLVDFFPQTYHVEALVHLTKGY